MTRIPRAAAISVAVAVLSLTACRDDSDDGEDADPPTVAEYCDLSEDAGTHYSWEPFHKWSERYLAGPPKGMPADARAGWEIRADAFEEIDEEFFEDEVQWDEWYDTQDWWSPEDQKDLAALDKWENSAC